jgi:release factor glutamine methyltransferase
MSTPSSPLPVASDVIAEVVRRLRAAGCVFAEDEAALLIGAAATRSELDSMVERRVAGIPLEQVVGWAEFYRLRIAVSAGVFVPRRRTELLVGEALAVTREGAVVLDLCCGSGALGVAVAANVSGVDLHAADLDPAAVACARRNVVSVGGQVYEGDLYAPLPADLAGRVDVLIANVPYVPSEAIELLPPEARLHEAAVALDGGADGLDVLRRVVADAAHWLAPGGHLFVETSERQAPVAAQVVADGALSPRIVTDDEATVVIGRRD